MTIRLILAALLAALGAQAASVTQAPVMVNTSGRVVFPTNLTFVGHVAWGTNAPLTLPSLTTTQRDALSATNGMLIYNSSNTRFERYEAGAWTTFAGGSGEANTASNLGTNGATVQGLYDSKSGVDLRFRSLLAGSGITISSNASTIEIAANTDAQAANKVYAGPTSGGDATPAFRLLVAADIPDLSATYQPLDADLTTYAGITPSANVQTLLGSADYAAFKTSLSLNNVENTALSTWAGSANITTLGTISSGTWQGTAVAVNKGGTGSTSASDARTALGLAIGTDVQSYDADLADLADGTLTGTKVGTMVGDSGSGGSVGAVPAPAAGDAAAGKFLKADGTWSAPSGGGGVVKQIKYATTTTEGSTATAIPYDGTIPQNTEGASAGLDLDITPTSGSSILIIEVELNLGASAAIEATGAIFVDSTADAIKAADMTLVANYVGVLRMRHILSAGSTSARTYKVRYGPHSGTCYLNRSSSQSDLFSTVMISSITITEFTP